MTTLKRGEKVAIAFSITDPNAGLGGKRVTYSIAPILKITSGVAQTRYSAPALKKTGGLPGSTSEITITSQTASAIAGTINIAAADFDQLPDSRYAASLWIDDGGSVVRCVTDNGSDEFVIQESVPRT
jgi:hypothetical protein